MSHSLHALLGEGQSHLVSFTWPTHDEWQASLQAVRELDHQHVSAVFLPHVHHHVEVFKHPSFPNMSPTRNIRPLPGHFQDPKVASHERVVLWSDGQLEADDKPELKVFPSAAAAKAYETTVDRIQGWFQARFVPTPAFVPVWDVPHLKNLLANHTGDDPLNLVERYKWSRQAKAFAKDAFIALNLDTGDWVAPTWQPGDAVAPLTITAPVVTPRRSRRP